MWQDTLTDRDPQTKGPGKEEQWKGAFPLCTSVTNSRRAPACLVSHSAHSEKCAHLGFREFWVNWLIPQQQNKKCRYFLGMNELPIAEEVNSCNCFFILSWRTFQEGVKNYMLLVLHLPSSPFFWLFSFFFLFFFFLVALHGMWDLSFLTRDQTRAPCIGSVES